MILEYPVHMSVWHFVQIRGCRIPIPAIQFPVPELVLFWVRGLLPKELRIELAFGHQSRYVLWRDVFDDTGMADLRFLYIFDMVD